MKNSYLKKGITFLLVFTAFLHTNKLIAQPDLVVVESALINSLAANTLDNDDDCYINEGCLGGFGLRQILRFTTHIKNVGDQDFYVGAPPSDPADENEVWEYDECHGHWHYEGYAEYVLFDENGNEVPIGFKNGFCLIDIECSGGGNFTYTCSNQGISAGCGDVYGSGLDCQWIDVTNLPDGVYRLVLRVNWDQDPDALGNYETNYTNNTGEVCFDLTTDLNGTASIVVLGNGSSCDNGVSCYEVTTTINLDDYPQETSWEIRNANNLIVVSSNGTFSGSPDGATVSETVCLEEGCYTFTINDTANDGICCGYGNGSYMVTDPSGNIIASGGDFSSSESTSFCVGPTPPCTDNDNDGICAAEDCDDNNSSVPAPPGASCNDGDPNTHHDEITADGCACEGEPIGGGGDCHDVSITTSSSSITVSGLNSAITQVQIFDPNWSTILNCSGNCNTTETTSGLSAGVYYVNVRLYTSSWGLICEVNGNYTVGGGGCPDNDNDGVCQANDCNDNNPAIPTTPGTACNDGNSNTTNDVIQSDGCTCQGSVVGCPDNDNDGVCQADDCNDNNPNVPTTPGTACNDGNSNTTNDVIQSDGCTCQGTSGGGGNCDDVSITTSSSSITVSGLNSPVTQVQIFNPGWATILNCSGNCGTTETASGLNAGVYYVKIRLYTSSWGLICEIDDYITVGGGGGCTDNDNDGTCQAEDCNDNNPNVPTTPGTACNDGNSNTTNDVIQSDGCTCQGSVVGCPDNDNDGVCQADDCNDNNPNVPTTPGTACNDGNSNTTNDVIQSDGCTCQGTSGGGGNCGDVSITTSSSSITVSGLNSPVTQVQIFNPGWATILNCSGNCGTTETASGLNAGVYYVRVRLYTSSWSLICEVNEYITVAGFNLLSNENEHFFFHATKDKHSINLNWVVTNTEDETSNFVLERSADGINFQKIETIESIYDIDGTFNYQTNDDKPLFGTNFYRLKLIRHDNSFVYSNIRRVVVTTHWNQFSVFPNPANESALINLAQFEGLSGKLLLIDQLGQTVESIQLDNITTRPIKMQLEEFSAGLYFIYLKLDGHKAINQKLVISKL